jgi:hypothetical protein
MRFCQSSSESQSVCNVKRKRNHGLVGVNECPCRSLDRKPGLVHNLPSFGPVAPKPVAWTEHLGPHLVRSTAAMLRGNSLSTCQLSSDGTVTVAILAFFHTFARQRSKHARVQRSLQYSSGVVARHGKIYFRVVRHNE